MTNTIQRSSRPNDLDHPGVLDSATSVDSSGFSEIKTIVNDESAIKNVHLKPGWKRCEFTDEGTDYEGRQLIGVIDRQMWKKP